MSKNLFESQQANHVIEGRSSAMDTTRRAFMGAAVAAGAVAASCAKSEPKKPKVDIPVMLDKAPDGAPLRAGLIGCGGRGRGAALNFLNAGPNLSVTHLADVFPDRIDDARKQMKEKGSQDISESNCFVGFDAYKRLLDTDIDVVIHATPPHFRPEHMTAAVAAGKHIFVEKPAAVDPSGIRKFIEACGQARTKGLTFVAGTCYRHDKKVIETYRRVAEGAIGDIIAGRCYFNTSQLWYRERQQGWTDMEWMIRNWVNWRWLSGDHIVEQHVHNLDTCSLYLGKRPVKCVAFGSRQRRVTGDQYDNFAVDFVYEDGVHLSSMSRQINGCANNVSDHFVGTKGSTDCHGTIFNPDGSVMWKFEVPEVPEGAPKPNSMYDQEHVDLVNAIRTGTTLSEGRAMAESTLMGIMGREAAYTGKEISWQEMLKSDMRLGPTEYTMSNVGITAEIPVPGADKNEG